MTAAHHTGSDPLRIARPAHSRSMRWHYAAAALAIVILPGIAQAREVRMQSPNGDGGGSSIELPVTAVATPDAARKATNAGANPSNAAKVPPMVRNADEASTVRQPRWHSFLPGMLR